MRNLISAEWTKMLPHKGTWLLVWIYPILLTIIMIIAMAAESKGAKPPSAAGWIEDSGGIWYVPTTTLGRYFIAAYFALVIAGEYGWNTWKLVVPHATRWKLIGAKYLVATGLLYLAWTVSAVITLLLMAADSAVGGEAIPQGVTLGAILQTHGTMIGHGIAPMLIAVGYASAAAVLTRSTMAAFIISLVLITLDELFGKLVLWLSTFGMEWLAVPYRVLPSYHLDNLASWMQRGVGFQARLAGGTVIAYSETVSLLAIGAWVAGLVALAVFMFRRQDIN